MVWISPILFNKWFCLLLSSSDKTSSNKSTGVSFVTFFTSSISDNFKLSAAVLCWPWEPYLRISHSPILKIQSSLWGPDVVWDNFKSLSLLIRTFAANISASVSGSYAINNSSLPPDNLRWISYIIVFNSSIKTARLFIIWLPYWTSCSSQISRVSFKEGLKIISFKSLLRLFKILLYWFK